MASAAALDPPAHGTLDAIHLATALLLRADLTAVVTYDRALTAAAKRVHVKALAPA